MNKLINKKHLIINKWNKLFNKIDKKYELDQTNPL